MMGYEDVGKERMCIADIELVAEEQVSCSPGYAYLPIGAQTTWMGFNK
jgi:hypothetical protein